MTLVAHSRSLRPSLANSLTAVCTLLCCAQYALQAALAKAQLAETAHRISERNAVEIVLKLMEMKKVQVRQQ